MELIDKQKSIGKQYKSFNIKAENLDLVSRKISGYAAIFNNVDKAKDMLIRGCFAKSINDRGPESQANDKIILLWMHDMDEPIGRITKLVEDERGLYFEAVIDEIPLGDRAIKQLESGTLNQFSFGYNYVWENSEWDNERDCFIVKEVVLYEISVVSIGCNGLTEYTGLKSEDVKPAMESLQKEIDRALATLTERESDIIKMFFGIGCQEMTLEEIGDKFQLTRERVRQIKEKAIRRLRQDSRSKLLKSYLG